MPLAATGIILCLVFVDSACGNTIDIRQRLLHPGHHHHHHHHHHQKRFELEDSIPRELRLNRLNDHRRHTEWSNEMNADVQTRQNFGRRKRYSGHHHPNGYWNAPRRDMELENARNISMCTYTVEPVTELKGTPFRDLKHIRCNFSSHKCHDDLPHYYCLQTYKNIHLKTSNTFEMKIRLLTGCVCAIPQEDDLEFQPQAN